MNTASTNHSILIVEDDLQFKKLLELKLKSILASHTITHCKNLADARAVLTTAEKNSFDLVVLDQHLPDGRGLSLLQEGLLTDLTVLAVSSDDDPQIPGDNLKAGAAYFLSKTQITQPLVKPLILGIIDRNRLTKELSAAKVQIAVMDSIKTLAATLRHEINNPLGAVLGGAYLLKNMPGVSDNQRQAADLVEQSGRRIKHVLEQIIEASSLDTVDKADTKVFQIPGDSAWGSESKE